LFGLQLQIRGTGNAKRCRNNLSGLPVESCRKVGIDLLIHGRAIRRFVQSIKLRQEQLWLINLLRNKPVGLQILWMKHEK